LQILQTFARSGRRTASTTSRIVALGLSPISHEIASHRRKPMRRLANVAAISSIPPTVPDLTWRRRRLPHGPAAQIGTGDQPAAGCHEAQNAGGDDDQLTCRGQQLGNQPRRWWWCWWRWGRWKMDGGFMLRHALAPLLSFCAWLSFNTTSPLSAKTASLARRLIISRF
jgi:hypothetical protein